MQSHVDDLTLSQLADGELPPDQTVRTLLTVLESESLRERLQQQLQLRDMTAAWRSQNTAMSLPATVARPAEPRREGWRAGSILTASVVGGVLVLAGVWLGQSRGPSGAPAPLAVQPAQRAVIAKVFAFHESVAGPLKGYVSDDASVELAVADDAAPTSRPLAMLLRLTTAGKTKDYVVVCRQDTPVTIALPQGDDNAPGGRLYLSPAMEQNEVGLQYALTMDGLSGPAVIAGRRAVGSDFRSLGEVALGDRNVRVEASAWPLE